MHTQAGKQCAATNCREAYLQGLTEKSGNDHLIPADLSIKTSIIALLIMSDKGLTNTNDLVSVLSTSAVAGAVRGPCSPRTEDRLIKNCDVSITPLLEIWFHLVKALVAYTMKRAEAKSQAILVPFNCSKGSYLFLSRPDSETLKSLVSKFLLKHGNLLCITKII
jgi:hypothetical protein